jgi:hypothetical protein
VTEEDIKAALPNSRHFQRRRSSIVTCTTTKSTAPIVFSQVAAVGYVVMRALVSYHGRSLHSFVVVRSSETVAAAEEDVLRYGDDVVPAALVEDVLKSKQQPARGIAAHVNFGSVVSARKAAKRLVAVSKMRHKRFNSADSGNMLSRTSTMSSEPGGDEVFTDMEALGAKRGNRISMTALMILDGRSTILRMNPKKNLHTAADSAWLGQVVDAGSHYSSLRSLNRDDVNEDLADL